MMSNRENRMIQILMNCTFLSVTFLMWCHLMSIPILIRYEAEEHQELVMLKEIAECCESDWIGMIPPGFFITK
jgi:hypothetical protein